MYCQTPCFCLLPIQVYSINEIRKTQNEHPQQEESLISVSSGFKSLRMHTQECHGCQMTRNFVRNSKLLIARSTIQPKLSKIKNHQEIHQNSLKNGKLFLILLNFGWMVNLAMSIFEFLTKISGLLIPLMPLFCSCLI